MRVAVVAFNGMYPFSSHGPALALYALVKGLEELGLEIDIFTRNVQSSSPKRLFGDNVKIINVSKIEPRGEPGSVRYAISFLQKGFSAKDGFINSTRLFRRYLDALNVELVYYNMPPIDPFTICFPILAKQNHKKQVYHLGGALINERKESVLRYVFKFMVKMGYFDAIIVPTRRARKAAEQLISAKGRSIVVPDCIYTPMYEGIRETDLELDGGVNILCVSRLVPIKRVDVTIKAFSKIAKPNSNVHLYIAGDGPLREALMMMARKLGVKDNVHFLGHISHDKLLNYYSKADIFVLSSDDENMSVASLEAMASKCAVVLTEPAAADLIEDGVNGVVFKPGDWQGLYEKLSALVNHPEIIRQLAEKAYETIKKRYDYKLIALKTKKIFEELLDR